MARRSWLSRVRSSKPDPLTSVVLTVPVFLTYHLGVLFIDLRNGADLVTGLTFSLLEHSVLAYVGVTLAAAGLLSLSAYVQRRRGRLRPAALGPVLVESLGWALLMMLTLGWATSELTAALAVMANGAAVAMGPLTRVVMAAGAGFHEEVLFRVVLLGGGLALLLRQRLLPPWLSVVLSCLGTAALFALVHHLGPLGDSLSLPVFAFRTLAGLVLSAVYLLRGFAIVVYTHTLYDVLVFFLVGG